MEIQTTPNKQSTNKKGASNHKVKVVGPAQNNSLGFPPRLSNEGISRIDVPGVFDLYVPSSFTEPQQTHSLHSTQKKFHSAVNSTLSWLNMAPNSQYAPTSPLAYLTALQRKHFSIQQGTSHSTSDRIMP
jgi:hypothetical protein